jgi:hypothetical protein
MTDFQCGLLHCRKMVRAGPAVKRARPLGQLGGCLGDSFPLPREQHANMGLWHV